MSASEARARVGEAWRCRMNEEHRAVAAFAQLTAELAETGAHPSVLGLVARACADEHAHVDLCRGVATSLLGAEACERPFTAAYKLPEYEVGSAERALLHAIVIGCLSETFTAAYLTALLERTRAPATKRAIRSLLADEVDHGRFGWAHLGWALERARDPASLRALVRAWLPRLLDETARPVFDEARDMPEPDDPDLERRGYLGRDAGARIYADALGGIVLPGFAAVGVDVSGLDRWLSDARLERRLPRHPSG